MRALTLAKVETADDQFESDAVADEYALAYCTFALEQNRKQDQPLSPADWPDDVVYKLRIHQESNIDPRHKYFGTNEQGEMVRLTATRFGLKAGNDEHAPIICNTFPNELVVRNLRKTKEGEEIWTDDQVKKLNNYQNKSGHPYIFVNDEDNLFVGIATKYGWVEKEGGPVVVESHLKVPEDLIY